MNENMEIEYKILIDQKTYQMILNDYQNYHEYIQVNYYFTSKQLEEKKYMLRIREKNSIYEMTLKRPMNHHRLETNVTLTKEEKDYFIKYHTLDNEIVDILKKDNIDLSQLVQQFSLTTKRCDIKEKYGTLSLDDNTYLSHQDYELEYEVFDEENGFKHFKELMDKYHLTYTKNCKSKIKRVLDSI